MLRVDSFVSNHYENGEYAMRFWHPGRVATGLEQGLFRESEKAQYLAGAAVIQSLFGRAAWLNAQTIGQLLTRLLFLGLSLAGIAYCYRANARGDGRAFLDRYVCLSLPLALWLFGGFAAMYYIAYYAMRWTGAHVTAATYLALAAPYVTGGYVLMFCSFYLLLHRYIRQVASRR